MTVIASIPGDTPLTKEAAFALLAVLAFVFGWPTSLTL